MKKQTALTRKNEDGFGIWSVIVLLALIALTTAVVFKTVSISMALIGFILVICAALLLANLPDIIRYSKISNM